MWQQRKLQQVCLVSPAPQTVLTIGVLPSVLPVIYTRDHHKKRRPAGIFFTMSNSGTNYENRNRLQVG